MKKIISFFMTFFLFFILISCSKNRTDYLTLLFNDWYKVEMFFDESDSAGSDVLIEQSSEYEAFVSDFKKMCESDSYDDYLSVYFDNNHNYFEEYAAAVHSGIENHDVEMIRSAELKFELISKNQNSKASSYYLILIIALSAILFLIFIILFMIEQRYEKELEDSEQLDVYSAFVMESVEKERSRISKEIHDTVLQDLRFVQFKADELKRSKSPEEIEAAGKTIDEMTGKSITNLRNICQNLTPSELKNVKDENTLVTAIRNLCMNFQEQNKIPCVLSIQNNLEINKISLKNTMNLFRIIQEALNNVQQHAQASYVSVVLKNDCKSETEESEKREKHLVIYITDDGKEFDVNAVPKHKHFGLENMKERARLIGAKLYIQSDSDAGTEIRLEL